MTPRHEQLLQAAEAVFARKGYADTTMADIAEAAGVTRPTVYAYFSSKDDVLAGVAGAVRDHFLSLQELAGDTPAETFELTLRQYLREFVRHYGVLVVIEHQALGDPAYERLLDQIHRRTNRRHEKFMVSLVEAGLAMPHLPPRMIAELVTGASMRFAQLSGADEQSEQQYGDALVHAHLSMLNLTAEAGRCSVEASV
ncbi:TetR/AcrR family transcriptional regulator [Cumulibacter soli]|uniref:TetR/AcrR family transcriptional regulator n=1 Tax=Cumulibacter soli TaxID=2546344 RepID=UPI0010679090|nr:TetR/AcrR family transcriptional regulator [Cumulibacter soli]